MIRSYVYSVRAISDSVEPEQWDHEVERERRVLRLQMPIGRQPVGDVVWEKIPVPEEPVPPGFSTYRFALHYAR